jgi:hypothetical protein
VIVVVTPLFVDCEVGKVMPLRKSGRLFIFDGLVRLECRNVPPLRSTVRVLSVESGMM